MILKQTILDNTEQGLDIILYYYPQAREVIDGRAKHFKMRDEKTASASIYTDRSNIWRVTDFGGDQVSRNCFELAMQEENKEFSEILHLLIQRHNINISLDPQVNKPQNFKSRDAQPDELDGELTYVEKKTMSDADRRTMGPHVTDDIMQQYGFTLLESYTWTKARKTYTITSSDDYPILLLKCDYTDGDTPKSFIKIAKPLEPNNANRFYYSGEKPTNYVFGLELMRTRFAALRAAEEAKDPKIERPNLKIKLPEIIIASGERDALNVASMGYNVVWFNSETTAHIDKVMSELYRLADRVINIPDIDATGIRVGTAKALRHLDMYTLWLPTSISQYRDRRGKPRKDLRDYLEIHPSRSEFSHLLSISQRARFWDYELHANGKHKESIVTADLLYYLRLNGFYKMDDAAAKDITHLIRIENYKVKIYTAKKIRDFVRDDLTDRRVPQNIFNLFLNSKRSTSTLMDDLSTITLSFDKCTPISRKFFFSNAAISVSHDNITSTLVKDINRNTATSFAWADNVSSVTYQRTTPSFSITTSPDGNHTINILNTSSHYFKFLINASRIYWREEYELRADADALTNKVYRHDNMFSPLGPRLTPEEQHEQLAHLINKIYVIGYLLHRHKIPNRAQAIWVMENKITKERESNGGSGKSLMIRMLQSLSLLEIETLNGRSKKMTENNFVLDRISTSTDIINIDDANLNIDFDYFFSMITGSTTINPKGSKSFEISFEDSPNIVFTSNFPPRDFSGSQSRRILYCVFSDYYHARANNQDNNDYNETHQPSDDLGLVLAGHQYTNDMYNADINFCIDCLQFYLSCLHSNIKPIMPPMDNVLRRLNIASMGQFFHEWAEIYLAQDSDNLNKLIRREDMYNNFISETGSKSTMTAQTFRKKLEAFIANTPYLAALNPNLPDFYTVDSKRRIIKKDDYGNTKEHFYVQTVAAASRPAAQSSLDL